ncbi:MAG TPA: sigma-70 family RNA polymerase sigma factor, partial [Gemmataceae bacterium]|nr:sigma-70 family RNA polymerase sigma factor [Gemmataceae bacterium]
APARSRAEGNLENIDEVQKLLRRLPAREREVVRLFYLEGRSYEEISTELHIPVNTIGPVLARARKKLREGGPPSTAVKAEKEKKPNAEAG